MPGEITRVSLPVPSPPAPRTRLSVSVVVIIVILVVVRWTPEQITMVFLASTLTVTARDFCAAAARVWPVGF